MKLDEAIDHVAKRMTQVDEDAALASRIIDSLPERRRGSWWLLGPAFAALAIAIAVLRTSSGGPPEVLRTKNSAQPLVASSALTAAANSPDVSPALHGRRISVEPRLSDVDHERSLPAIAAVAALAVDSLVPDALLEEEALTLAPLTIEPLALEPVQR